MVILGEDGYNLHLQFTPDLANDWKNAMFAGMLSSDELTTGSHQYLLQRVLDSMNASQLESKMWLVQTLMELKIKPKRVALLAGWFGQYIVPLMFDTFKTCEWIENFEIDYDVAPISYKFNKRYKDKDMYKINAKAIKIKPVIMRLTTFTNLQIDDVLIDTLVKS